LPRAWPPIAGRRLQVVGCDADLYGEPAYSRRYKACAVHREALVAVVAGKRQRFCQQVSGSRMSERHRRRLLDAADQAAAPQRRSSLTRTAAAAVPVQCGRFEELEKFDGSKR
jgi:hypothetical protein